jgi:hypothetical protein
MNRGAVAGVAADVRSGSIASVRVCWPYVSSCPDSDRNSDLRARRLSAISEMLSDRRKYVVRCHGPSDPLQLEGGSLPTAGSQRNLQREIGANWRKRPRQFASQLF